MKFCFETFFYEKLRTTFYRTEPKILGPKMRRSQRRTKINCAVTIHEILLRNIFLPKTSKNILQDGTEDSRTRNATVPAEDKIDRAVMIHENLLETFFQKKDFQKGYS